jgi:2-keto-4-pentenoate hydratase/2-oxohepta-3-ene-1,7-dioic acid hydratase in catechol pathway
MEDIASNRLLKLRVQYERSRTYKNRSLSEYCSTFTILEPGDVIITGTTGGVGAYRKPPLWLKPGDVVEVEVSGVGLLRNLVVQEGTPGT